MKFKKRSFMSRSWSNSQAASSLGVRWWCGIRLSPMFSYSSESFSKNWSYAWSASRSSGMWIRGAR